MNTPKIKEDEFDITPVDTIEDEFEVLEPYIADVAKDEFEVLEPYIAGSEE